MDSTNKGLEMLDGNSERAGVDEIYQCAGNTSNLTVEADRKGAGDVVIAAGWSPSRVGMALLRLHSEWDAAVKPRRVGKTALDVIAASIKAQDASNKATAQRTGLAYVAPKSSAQVRAQEEADRWFASELRLLATSLKGRAVVWEQLTHWTTLKAIDPHTVAEALLHWLDPVCGVCDGHGLKKVPNAPALSARQCHKCHGSGERSRPADSTKVLNYIDDCCQKARQSLKSRLRNSN